jgi:putative cell wall-binding protein
VDATTVVDGTPRQPLHPRARLRSSIAIGSFVAALGILVLSVALASAAGAPGADMTIAKSASPASVAVGGSYTYSITVHNSGTISATGVRLIDNSVEPDVDINFATLSWTPASAGSCAWKISASDPNNLRCTFNTMAPGASVTVTFDVTAPMATCPRVRNTAQVSATNEPLANQDNNTATVNVPMTGCPSVLPTPSPSASPTVTRIAGSDRYATAALVSKKIVPSPGAGVASVYVASGQAFPDALAAAPAAAKRNTSVLLVSRTAIPAATQIELQRLKPATIYLVGGTGAISTTVENALKGLSRTGTVVRFAGFDRYDTAARVVANAFPSATQLMVATGLNYPDALAGSAGAAHSNMPILLVTGTSIPGTAQAQITRLNPAKVYIVGGEGVVSVGVENALRSGGRLVVRVSGDDRYLTSVAVSRTFFSGLTPHIFVATGVNFPDALAAGPKGDPVLLTTPTSLPGTVAAEVTRLDPDTIDVLGGPSVVSDTVLNQLRGT